MEGELLAKSD